MVLNKKVVDKVTVFLNENYSNLYGGLISGSYVDGTNNEYSDIDVIVFSKDRNTVFNEVLSYKGLKVQTVIIPIQNIKDILWMDYITCKGSFINMISKGVILFDTLNYLKNLISHTQELKLLGGRPLTEDEAYLIRIKITSQLHDIMGANHINELIFPTTYALELVTEFKLKINGHWCGKYRMRDIKNLDEKFYLKLIDSIQQVYGNQNKKPLVNLIKSLLRNNGGLVSYRSKSNSISKVIDDYLVIEIEGNERDIKHTINSLIDFLSNIENPIAYYCFSSKPVGKNKIEQAIYMVIEAKKDYINDTLINHLNLFVEKKDGLSKLLFPYQYDPIYSFSTKDIYCQIAPLFYKVSELVTKNPNRIFNQSFQLKFSLTLLNHIKIIWFNNDTNRFSLFMDYLMDCWLVFSYDDGLSYKINDLLKKKKQVLEKFESMYQSQKKELNTFYYANTSFDKEILVLLTKTSNIDKINNIPSYKTYLIDEVLRDISNPKQISLHREIIFRLLSINFIDNRFVSYIPFVVKKIEANA